jgi:hypothetical protein
MLSKPLYNIPFALLLSTTAYAGDLGDQQEVGKGDKPASIDLRGVLRVDSQKLLLSREDPNLPSSGNTLFNEEANYKRSTTSLVLLTEIDLAAKVGLFGALPIVISDSQTLTLSPTSTLEADGIVSANAPDNVNRKGVGNATLGVKFHLASQDREPTQPFWTLSFAGHLPTGEQRVAGSTGVGDGLFGLSGELLFSRRFGQLQPYASFNYLGRFESSDDPLFRDLGRGQRSIRPGHQGGAAYGLQYIAYQLEEETKITIDLGGEFHFVTLGRDYTPLFDFTAETDPTQNALRGVDSEGNVSDTTTFDGLLDEEQHTRSSFHLGVDARVATNIRLQAFLGVTHTGAHFLTFGSAGVDNNGDGVVTDFEEQNPFFQPELDTPGTRIRAEQNNTFTFGLNLGANF